MVPGRLQRVRASFALIEPCGPALVARVLSGIADNHPDLYALAHGSSSATFNTRAWNTFARVIGRVGEFRTLQQPLMALGIQLSRQGVGVDELRDLRLELIQSMADLLGEDWTDRIRRDWEFVLEALCGALMRGALQNTGLARQAA